MKDICLFVVDVLLPLLLAVVLVLVLLLVVVVVVTKARLLA